MTFFTLFLLWGLGWLWFATTVAMAKANHEETQTDAIIVLTGGTGRINAGLDLLAKQGSGKLFISGVNENVSKQEIFDSWEKPAAKQPCCVYLGYNAVDTTGNAEEVKEWVKENNIKSFRLVTSSYHMPRAHMEISRILPGVEIVQYPVLSDDFQSWEGRFWPLTFSEYNKTLISWLRLNNDK